MDWQAPRAALAVLLLVGCTGQGADDTGAPDTEGEVVDSDSAPFQPDPLLRAVHLIGDLAPGCDLSGDTADTDASAGLACIDLYVGDGIVPLNGSGPFPFGASTAFVPVPVTGTYTFHAVAHGEPNVESNHLLSWQMTLGHATAQSVIAFGSAETEPPGAAALVVDDLATLEAPAGDSARVRVFNGFVPGAADPDGVDVAIDGTLVADDATYGAFAAPASLEPGAEPATLVITVDASGEGGPTNDGTPDWAGQIPIAPGTHHDVFLVYSGEPTAPYLGLVHTTESNEPDQVPMGPAGG